MANRNWRFAFERVRRGLHGGCGATTRRLRRTDEVRSEWGRFTEQQLDLLLSLSDPEEVDLAAEPEEVLRSLEAGGAHFLRECLVVALEHRERNKFTELFALVDRTLEEEGRLGGCTAEELWPQLFSALLQKAVEMGSSRAVRILLSLAHGSSPPRLPLPPNCSKPRPNDPCLLAACRRDDYDVVKLFVSHGYRIRHGYMTQDSRAARLARGETTWRDYAEVPFLNEEQRQLGMDDQIYNLLLLRMMSRPSYIFACYMVVAEKWDLEADDLEERPVICECPIRQPPPGHSKSSRRRRMGLNDVMAAMVTSDDDVFHHCPASEKYSPHPDCAHHMECNDPVYRCFDLARYASEGAKRVPEFRTEFTQVAQECRTLAARMLDGCASAGEVTTLLEEKAASSKYFWYHTQYVRFPRIRLAVEHSHKEFVSHTYCQQFLRNEWLGHTNWEGKMLPFKLLYFLLQLILSPVYVIHALVVLSARDVKVLNDGVIPEVSSARTKFQELFFSFLHYCDKVTLNLDAPINRFLTTMGYFVVYLCLIVVAAIRPLSDTLGGADKAGWGEQQQLAWYHVILLVYAANQLYRYLLMAILLRGVSHFFNLWRVAFLLSYGCVFSGLLLLVVISLGQECEHRTKNLFVCPGDSDAADRTQALSDASACLFGLGSIGSVILVTYTMQMHDRLGPIIISYSRVTLDFVTMTVLYAIMILAFSFGFAYILSSDRFVSEELVAGLNQTTSDLEAFGEGGYGVAYKELFSTLFWSILNPGPPEYDLVPDTAKHAFVTFWFAFFQIMSVIVFLNLLIATMNSTVQRVESDKDTFWKFTRTSVWIEFYDVTSVLPPPFTMFNIVWMLFYAVFMATKTSR